MNVDGTGNNTIVVRGCYDLEDCDDLDDDFEGFLEAACGDASLSNSLGGLNLTADPQEIDCSGKAQKLLNEPQYDEL